MIKYNKLILASFIILFSCSGKTQSINGSPNSILKRPPDNHDSITKAWKNHDTDYFRGYIIHLKEDSFPELARRVSNLSIITGFGWSIADPYDSFYQKNDTSNVILRKNMIRGFEIYLNSNLFMHKINGCVIMHNYFYYDNQKLLSKKEENCLLKFANDLADSTFYHYYIK